MRIVRIRQGFNPNSSSLSINMTALLAATGLVSLGTFVVATAFRLFRREKPSVPATPAPPVDPPPQTAAE
ncbi:MAG: hypothetical protein HY897_11450 [Deltaproteobacteria bacterium]|nr:hypothetical protein [Deltaproteobacteria bacterium]